MRSADRPFGGRPRTYNGSAIAEVMEDWCRSDRAGAFYPDLADKLICAGVQRTAPRYLHFGDVPEGGRSQKRLGLGEEQGLSVYSGDLTREGHYVLRAHNRQLRALLRVYCRQENRPGYLVSGSVVGRGASGERLLRGVREVVPVPDDCIVAVRGGSEALDMWNFLRMGAWLEDLPRFAHLFEEVERG